jgi:D-sedoheptulose 7-phosphate isomerase
MDNVDTYLDQLQNVIAKLPRDDIRQVIRVLLEAWRDNRQVFLCGNGGSAATASHFANDLNKATIVPGQPRFRAICLADNVPLLTAWANDAAYEDVFAEQLVNFLNAGDVVIAISGSGNSPNVLKAVQTARAAQALTIGLTGFQGGKLKDLVDHCVVVPSDAMMRIEDVHMVLDHCISSTLRELIAKEGMTPQ